MHPRGLSPLDTTIHRPMKQTLRLLLLLMALLLASVSGFAETVDSAVACDDVTHCVPSHERREPTVRRATVQRSFPSTPVSVRRHAMTTSPPRSLISPAPHPVSPIITSSILIIFSPMVGCAVFSRPVIPMPGPTTMSMPSGTSFAAPFSLDADVPTAACPACVPLAALPCVAVASPFPFIYIPPLGVAPRAVPPWMPTAPRPATRPPITIIIT